MARLRRVPTAADDRLAVRIEESLHIGHVTGDDLHAARLIYPAVDRKRVGSAHRGASPTSHAPQYSLHHPLLLPGL